MHIRVGVRRATMQAHRLFYGFIGSCERDEYSSQAKQQEEKPNKYGKFVFGKISDNQMLHEL